MRATFAETKQLVLAALYEHLYSEADQETAPPNLVYSALADKFSLGYTKRALSALVEDGLVETDGDGENPFYTLTQNGLMQAEGHPPLAIMGARFILSSAKQDDRDIPASDRIVRLDHNQVYETESSVSNLLEALENDNGDPEQEGLRERLIGQIKAGRELIRAGEFRAYLLYEVLVKALGELIARYKNPTVSALANALLGAIVAQVLQTN